MEKLAQAQMRIRMLEETKNLLPVEDTLKELILINKVLVEKLSRLQESLRDS
jgi:hypothetical protein